jgi:hypothetical protein
MGQKSNLTTVRNFLKSINLFTYSKQEFLIGFNFLENFNRFCNLNNNIIVKPNLNFIGSQMYLTFSLFVRSAQIKKIKKRLKIKRNKLKFNTYFLNYFFNSLLKHLKFLKINLLNVKVILLNNYLISEKKFLRFLYLRIQFFRDSLFPRRYNLFFDFLKISSLFIARKIPAQTFLFFLGQIFKFIPKKKHNRYFSFIKKIFNLMFGYDKSILGLKLLIGGRLKGKLRKKKIFIQTGKIPVQTIAQDIEFTRLHVFSKYGVFGFKFWVCFKTN